MGRAKATRKIKAHTPERAERQRLDKILNAAAVAGVPEIQRDTDMLVIHDVVQIGKEATPIRHTVRKLTRIEILARSGVLEAHEAAACEWYAAAYSVAWDTVGLVANYEGRSGGGLQMTTLLARYQEQKDARDDIAMACEVIPAKYRPIFDAVVCTNQTISGVAASVFDLKRSQGENKVRAVVKLCANLLYGRIAPLLPVKPPIAEERPTAKEEKVEEAAPVSKSPISDALDAAIATRGASGDLVEIWMAKATLHALAKEVGWQDLAETMENGSNWQDQPKPAYRGISIHGVETWTWGILFNVIA